MKQFKWILGLMLVGVFAVACSSPAPEEPTAGVVAEEVEVVEEEAMEDEVMDEEEMEEEEEAIDEEEMEEAMDEGEVTYVVNAADSSVVWTGAKAVGDSHTGTVNISEGALVVADGSLVSGSFVLDMRSIVNQDLSGGMKARIEDHLKSDDFFGVAEFPEAMVAITSAEANGDGTYNVIADLTIKGITNPIEFITTATEESDALMATADIIFDRAVYNVQYGSGAFFSDLGDDLINDDVEISVALVASK